MVFVHGGHFDQGSGGCLLYDGTNLAADEEVIVVTFNYRLGALGWMVTDSLTGNYGFLDQQAALKWVQTNIANFGGDPKQVTIFGQSAGATSIRGHLVAPSSKSLFHRAIIQSDPVSLPMLSTREASDVGAFFMNQIGCTDTACLLSQNITRLLEVQKLAEKHISLFHPLTVFLPFTPTVDGTLIPKHIFDAISAGSANRRLTYLQETGITYL